LGFAINQQKKHWETPPYSDEKEAKTMVEEAPVMQQTCKSVSTNIAASTTIIGLYRCTGTS